MTLVVKYFASLREQLGRAEDRIEIEGAATVAEVWRRVSGAQELPDNLRAAVNHEYADAATVVGDGDEIGFFPPVTGG